jgi:hypothetical protein
VHIALTVEEEDIEWDENVLHPKDPHPFIGKDEEHTFMHRERTASLEASLPRRVVRSNVHFNRHRLPCGRN